MIPNSVSRRPLFVALFLYFALTAALIARVPLAQSPDEAAHWQYVEHIAQLGNLPVFRGAAPPAPGYEFHQPPLYYLLCAPWWKWLGAGVQNYACRAVSMFCGLATLIFIWNSARLLFPSKPRVATLAVLFAALFPLHQAVGAGSNNDALAGLLAAALFFLLARIFQNGLSRSDVWQLGLAAGLAILTKNTLLVLVFTGFLALVFASKKPNSRVSLLPALGIALGITLLVGGPWLVRNQLLYGDPLALGAFGSDTKLVAPGFPAFAAGGMDFLSYARGFGWITFMTAWGFFGGSNSAVAATFPLSASGPRMPQLWLAPLVLLCLALLLLGAWGWWRGNNRDETGENSEGRAVWGWWMLGVALVLLAWAQFGYNFFAGAQARYLHPALLPFCVFLALGWTRLFSGAALKFAGVLFGATLGLLTLLNLLVWKTLV